MVKQSFQSDRITYDFSLSDQFGSIKLSDCSFEDFVSDRRKNSLVVAIELCEDSTS